MILFDFNATISFNVNENQVTSVYGKIIDFLFL